MIAQAVLEYIMYHRFQTFVLVIMTLRGCCHGQFIDPATTADPCANDANPTTFDNLSCPRLDGVLQCYPRSELCDTNSFCTGGSDEGTGLVSLDCKPMIMSTSTHCQKDHIIIMHAIDDYYINYNHCI